MNYDYTAINEFGKTLNGTVSAESLEGAVSELKEMKYYIVDIREGSVLQKNIKFSLSQKVGLNDISFFCRQMATMLNAGVNVLASLDLIRRQTRNKKFKAVLDDVYEMVEGGNPVYSSLGKHTEVFSPILVNMVEAGEVGGSLDESFKKMSSYFEKQSRIRNKLKNALVYPCVILVVTIIVVNILLMFVLPTFVGMFKDMNIEVPLITQTLINCGSFMKDYWYVLLLFIFLVLAAFKMYKKSPSGSLKIGKLKLKFPIFGKIAIDSEIDSISYTMSTLFGAGISLVPALYTAQKLISNRYIAYRFESVIERVKEGESLSRPISDMDIFPPLVPVMIRTGEESGNLEMMLDQLADFYEEEIDNSVTRLTALFEPMMMIFLAVIIGFLLASIMLPMFQLYGNIK